MSKLNVTTSTTRPASPNTGSIFFESDTNKLIFWDGTVWHMFDRDSVTAAAPSNTLTFDLTFNNSDQGYSESGLTFSVDSSHVSTDYAGTGTLASYSADGVSSSGVKFYVVWEDDVNYEYMSGNYYDWAGWSLYYSTDGGSTLERLTYNYSGMTMPYTLLTFNTPWDHNVAAPFNLDLASSDGGSNYYITYDGNGSSGDSGDQYQLSWDTTSAFSFESGGTNGTDFYNSRTGEVPS